MPGSPTAQRRRLGRLLRSLREEKNLNGEEAAAAAERSASWLSRIESGQAALRQRELRDLLDLYGLKDQARRADLEQMANAGRQRGWWSDYTDVMDASFIRFVGLESEATTILTFEDHAIPGLLQSPLYMRGLFRLVVPALDAEVTEAWMEFRTLRQQLLREAERPHFTVILDEAVLQRPIGGSDVAHEQLSLLLDAIDGSLVEFQILPLSYERMPLHAFTVLQFEDDPTITHLDTLSGGVFEETSAMVGRYEKIFAYLRAIALGPPESRRIIETLKEALE